MWIIASIQMRTSIPSWLSCFLFPVISLCEWLSKSLFIWFSVCTITSMALIWQTLPSNQLIYAVCVCYHIDFDISMSRLHADYGAWNFKRVLFFSKTQLWYAWYSCYFLWDCLIAYPYFSKCIFRREWVLSVLTQWPTTILAPLLLFLNPGKGQLNC